MAHQEQKEEIEKNTEQEEKMLVWNELKSVPEYAKKNIVGGRLKGMTDIKPQWRLEKLTAVFGMIGFGWTYNVTNQWVEDAGTESGEKAVFLNIELFVKLDDQWSKPIFGTGGNSFVTKEKYGMYVSDEAYKMALTDAISVASKQLGLASDVYMGYSNSKYPTTENSEDKNQVQQKEQEAEDKKPWLNETVKGSDEPTKLWLKITKAIEEGRVTSLKQLREHYKVSKTEGAKLEKLLNK